MLAAEGLGLAPWEWAWLQALHGCPWWTSPSEETPVDSVDACVSSGHQQVESYQEGKKGEVVWLQAAAAAPLRRGAAVTPL